MFYLNCKYQGSKNTFNRIDFIGVYLKNSYYFTKN